MDRTKDWDLFVSMVTLFITIVGFIIMMNKTKSCEENGGHMVRTGAIDMDIEEGVCVRDGKVIEP